jgi:hypothetical protein
MKIVIGLMGVKQSGKSTVAQILAEDHGFAILEPGRQVMDLLLDIDPYMNIDHELVYSLQSEDPIKMVDVSYRVSDVYAAYGYEGFKKFPEGRRLLQELGTRIRHREPLFWVDQQRKFITESDKHVVHTAVRFPNEARLIRGWDGYVWEIIKPDVDGNEDHHESETAWREVVPSREIMNDGTLSDLRDTVSKLIKELR